MSLDRFINSVRAEVAKRFNLKTNAEINAFFIGLEESAKDNQEALEKRDKMLRDTVAELCEAKRLLKAAVEDINYYVDCYEAHCDECCCDHDNRCHWKHEAEALALIGEDANVGHKSGGWISCEERMPEVNEPVLFVFNTGSGFKAVMYGWHETIKGLGSGWHQAGVGGARADEEVTYWQPLPEPPKDGERNDT